MLRVVLVEPRNPLNIGAVARAMSNFGFFDLRLVNPYDVAFRDARSAVGAGSILQQATVCTSLAAALGEATLVVGTTSVGHRQLQLPLYRLEPAALLLREHFAHSPSALVFGSEKFGLSNDDLSHCHWLLRIPTREAHGSMNLGQAVAICLYELRRDAVSAAQELARPAAISSAAAEQLTALLFDALSLSGYVNSRTTDSTGRKLRRLLRRLRIPASDTEAWLGILRQLLWKLKQ